MRRLAVILAAACLAVAGCGGDDSGSPLDAALGHLPEDAPLALVVSTDLESEQFQAAGEAVRSVPFGSVLLEQLESEVAGDKSFEEDIAPLLGNEAVVGIAEPQALLADELEGFVAALQVEDAGRLEELVSEGAERAGEAEGATLYRDGDTFFAVEDDLLVVADGEERLRAALEQREADDRLREEDLEQAFEDLPGDAPVRLYANVAALLESDPATATARRVPFVDAIETFAATVRLEGGKQVAVDFALDTGGQRLEQGQLPIAAGEQAPPVIGREGEIGVGIRDPARIVEFAQTVAQAVSPEGFAQFELAKRQLAEGLDVDIDRDVVGQFSGNTSVAISPDGEFAVRSQLENPRAFERTLSRLARVIPDFAEGAGFGEVAVARPRGDEDFYAVAGEDGDGIVYGVVDDVFVLASDAQRAGDLVTEQPRPVEGARGAVVASADAGELARIIIAEIAGPLAAVVDPSAALGLLTGSLEAREDGLRGSFRLDLEG